MKILVSTYKFDSSDIGLGKFRSVRKSRYSLKTISINLSILKLESDQFINGITFAE